MCTQITECVGSYCIDLTSSLLVGGVSMSVNMVWPQVIDSNNDITFCHLLFACHEVWSQTVPNMAWRSRLKCLFTLPCPPPLPCSSCWLMLWFIASGFQIVQAPRNIFITQAQKQSESERMKNRTIMYSFEPQSLIPGGKICLRCSQEICLASYWPDLSHMPTFSQKKNGKSPSDFGIVG